MEKCNSNSLDNRILYRFGAVSGISWGILKIVDTKLQKGLKVSLEIAVISVFISFSPQRKVVLTTKQCSFHNQFQLEQ